MSDYYHPASWDGVAIHASHAETVVCVNVSDYIAKNSGKDQVQTMREPGEPCARCGVSGTEPNALSYEEAKARPSEAHRNKADREAGLPRMVIAFGSSNVSTGPSISRSDYHQDGRPKCVACYGRGHAMREVRTVRFTWPTFSATPSGRAWHVEVNGCRIATGTGFARCDDYGERAQNAAAGVVDEIEAAVRRGLNMPTTTVTTSTPTAQAPGPLTTIATGGGITVHAEYDHAKGWTYLQLEPRVSKTQYDDFMARFRGTWHRMRRRPVIYRLVGANELARFFGPLAGEEQAQPEPMAAATVEAPQAIDALRSRAYALRIITATIAQAGAFDRATDLAKQISDPSRRADALRDVAAAFVEAGKPDCARAILAQARASAQAITAPRSHAYALSAIAIAFAQTGAFDEPMTHANRIDIPRISADTLSAVAVAVAMASNPDQAHRILAQTHTTAQAIDDPNSRAHALSAVAKAIAQAGVSDQATKLAKHITDPRSGTCRPRRRS